ncbi:MAG: endolytic transglycosylase MltG [Anaerolineae bacterium]|nr:endolytic transglycosylase MltG [Anaerolineae bacterium]
MKKSAPVKASMQRSTQEFSMIIMFAILFLCVMAAVTLVVLFWVPSMARDTFGPPAESVPAGRQFLLSLKLILQKNELTRPIADTDAPILAFVDEGENAWAIADRLERNHLIPDAAAFLDYLVYKGADTTLQHGTFELNGSMSAMDVARILQSPVTQYVDVSFLKGWRVEEYAGTLPSYGIVENPSRLVEIARNPLNYGISSRLPIEQGLEGFLLPGDYRFEREGLTVEDIVYALVLNFEASLPQEWEEQYARNGLTLREAVILASIVEKETMVDSEMPRIASVFYNRLAAGMKLETDPTVQYALGWNADQDRWWTNPLTLNDLAVDSPYNTYLYSGLPPGPICNPRLEALQAVAYPEQTDYYYFRRACDDSDLHNFSFTYEEHLAKSCQP